MHRRQDVRFVHLWEPGTNHMEILVQLWPDLLAQFLMGWILLYTFTPSLSSQSGNSFGKTVCIPALFSLGMLILSLLIEFYLSPFLFQGSIVLQWVLFVLLGTRLCGLRLGKSMLAQFCFFSLMLGAGMLSERTEPDEKEPQPQGIDLTPHVLTHRLPAIRNDVLTAVYGTPEDVEPEQATPEDVSLTKVHPEEGFGEPPPSPTEPPVPPEPDPSDIPPPAGNPEEVATPASPTPPAATAELPAEQPAAAPVPPTPTAPEPLEVFPTEITETPGVVEGDTSIRADQMSEITEVKNRSSDKRYAPPTYDVTAVSLGSNGRFAMVNGNLLREGAVLRTGGSDPRGWKLLKVTPTEVLWQPLQ